MPSFCLRVATEVLFDEGRGEAVKTGCYCRVSSEEIAGPCCSQCRLEGFARRFHEVACPLQHGERRVPLIQVTDLRLNSQCAKQPPSAYPEQYFLLEAQFGAAAI